MTMLQIHEDALESVNTAYHEFLLRYKASSNIVYGIVEGKEDPMFYRGFIEHYLPAEWEVELMSAGRKDNVLKAITIFDWTRFSNKRICFFVDKDLSLFLQKVSVDVENLYVTDNYSIENEAVNFRVLKRLLEEVLNISDLKPTEIDLLERYFYNALECFQESILPVMAQIVLWRRAGKRPCLDDIRPKEYFTYVNGTINLRDNFNTVQSRLEQAAMRVNLEISSQEELSQTESEFRQLNGKEKFIRGKYLLWFFVSYANEIHNSLSSIITRYTVSPKVRISLGSANAMAVLAPRIRCPSSLQNFLKRTYCQYIKQINGLESEESRNQ